MKPGGSLPHLQDPATRPYPEPCTVHDPIPVVQDPF
jgi:hypothetical protein